MVGTTETIIITLNVILFINWGLSYLMYVRIRDLRHEVEEIRAKVNVTEGELNRMESSIESINIEY